MNKVLMIGGGLAALYLATQKKESNSTVISNENNFNHGNISDPVAPVEPESVVSENSHKSFLLKIVGLDPSKTGFTTVGIKNTRFYNLAAEIEVKNISQRTLNLKKASIKSSLLPNGRQTIVSSKIRRSYAPGESQDVQIPVRFLIPRETPNMSAEEVLKTVTFEVNI